jgi:hypothetical protein
MAFPGTYNFNYYRGDTFEFIVRPKDANGNSFLLAEYGALMTIATVRGPVGTTANPRVTYNASATVDGTNNIITCRIIPSVGRSLEAGRDYFYDVQITDTDDNTKIFTLLTGQITVTNDITGAVT